MKTMALAALLAGLVAPAALAQPGSPGHEAAGVAASGQPDDGRDDAGREAWRGPAPGAAVLDSRGVVLGEFQAWARSRTQRMAVLEVDGKLVSVPQDTLHWREGRIYSSQSKAEVLAAAGAPR